MIRFTRSRYPAFLSLLFLLLFAACSNTAAVDKPEEEPAPAVDLHVTTYNIHHGEGTDGVLDLNRIANIIKAEKADLVALQEVDRGTERTNKTDVIKELSRLTGLQYWAFGKNIDYQGGEYGNGVLSRYPIVSQQNTHLRQITTGEQRGVLQTVVDVQGRKLAFLAVHFDVRNQEERNANTKQVAEEILPLYKEYPILLAGDFNDQPTGTAYAKIDSVLTDAWTVVGTDSGFTIPVSNPTRRIDFIFHTDHLKPVVGHVMRSNASDHLPVSIGFEWVNK